MGNMRNNQSGFSAVEAVLILVILGIVGFTGWFVWHTKQNTDKTLNSNNSTTPVVKKKATTSSSNSSDPYDGWKNGTLVYEKLNFKYPSNWSLKDNSKPGTSDNVVSPGSDNIVLTAPNGFQVELRTGIGGVGDGGAKAISDTVKIAGTQYALGYLTGAEDNADPNNINALYVTQNNGIFLPDKNVKYGNQKAVMSFGIGHGLDASTAAKRVSVTALQGDPSYKTAVNILDSLSY